MRLRFQLLLPVGVAIVLLACSGLVHAQTLRTGEASASTIAISTGSPVGVYFAAGNAICRLVQRAFPERDDGASGLACAAGVSAGSLANVEALKSGTVSFAIIQSDVIQNASKGLGPYEGRRIDTMRSLFSLHGEPYQLLVNRSSGMANFLDIKGRKVNLGEPGTVQSRMLGELLRTHKLDERSLGQPLSLSVAEQFRAICDEDIEAFGMLIGFPNSGYTTAMRNCGARLIDIDTEAVRKMVASTPYYARIIIPKSTYPGQVQDVSTFGVLAVMATRADAPDEIVDAVVRSVFGQIEQLRAMHPSLNALDPRRMIRDGLTAPLHPVALKYYREQKWM